MTDTYDLQLRLPALPEGIGVVRQALAGVADAAKLDPTLTADLKMAVSEACTNAVIHAYQNQDGYLEVKIALDDDKDRIIAVVSDEGSGISPTLQAPKSPSLGLGMPLIAALSESFEISENETDGTQVRMIFSRKPGDSNNHYDSSLDAS